MGADVGIGHSAPRRYGHPGHECAACGADYVRWNAAHRWCSPGCRLVVRGPQPLRRPGTKRPPRDYVCSSCGARGTVQGRGATPRYCDACSTVRRTRRADREATVRSCERCGADTKNRRFCSARCRQRPEATCLLCGIVLTAPRRRRYCTPECAHAAKSRTARDHDHRRRALKRGATAEAVDRRAVFERDGWRCGICGESIDSTLRYPDPASASVDHVLPLAAGGSHTYANVQAAHLSCNSAKRDGRGGGSRWAESQRPRHSSS